MIDCEARQHKSANDRVGDQLIIFDQQYAQIAYRLAYTNAVLIDVDPFTDDLRRDEHQQFILVVLLGGVLEQIS